VTPLRTKALGLLGCLVVAGSLSACGGGFSAAQAPPPDPKIHSYVALGDGYTAAPYTAGTVSDDGCLRSVKDYPALVAADLGINDVRDVSCTGATTDALTKKFKPGKGKPEVPAQIDAVSADTDLITVGMGIEDGDLLHEMFAVCAAQPCAPGTTYYTQVLDDLNRSADAFTAALRQIQDKAPQAYLVVVGYPRLTPAPDAGCGAFPQQTIQGRDVPNYVLDQVNGKLESAARQTGAAYVDVASLSADHVLCSDEPWVQGMKAKPGKVVPYHPVEAEQRAVADQILSQLKER